MVNIGLEGMMLAGALAGVAGSFYTGQPWWGVAWAAGAGALLAVIMAVMCITLKADPIICGVAINVLAVGATGTALFHIFGSYGSSPSVPKLLPLPLPLPWLAQILAPQTALFYLGILAAAVTWVFIYRTPWGLRIRATGKNPAVAASVGIKIRGWQYLGVIASGTLCGLGGAALSLADLSQFVERMSDGRGFIALAAMLLAQHRPGRTLLICLLFGMADAVSENLQISLTQIPSQFFLMLPFALTLLVLILFKTGHKS